MLAIGNYIVENRVVSAPLAGVTDKAFRIIARSFGAGLVFSEMISDQGLIYNQEKTARLAEIGGEEGPVVLQIFGSNPEYMGRGAAILEKMGAPIIDINMGCPTPKIVKNGEGSALMQNLPQARQVIRAVAEAVHVPVTVKMRRGWEDGDNSYLDLAAIAQEEGVKAITLHPRSRRQFFSGQSDWSCIRELKKHSAIPVIGNGDIWSAQDALRMLEETGCDAVMIGRGAMGNPFLFRETVALIEHGETIAPPTVKERITTAIHHLDLCIEFKGEPVAVREMRKHLSWYIKGLHGAARLREKINQTTTRDEMVALLNALGE